MRSSDSKHRALRIMLVIVFVAGAVLVGNLGSPATSFAQTSTGFLFPDFRSTADLELVGSAGRMGDVLRLTSSDPCCQAGAAWQQTRQHVQDGFVSTFQFRISDPGEYGADGFAFVIQNASDTALGTAGCGVGYEGIPNSIAIEFDTFLNGIDEFGQQWPCSWRNDPSHHHISVHSQGSAPNSANEPSLGSTSTDVDFSDGITHTVKIAYVPGTLQVFLDDTANPTLIVADIDLSTLELDSGLAWVGFVAATGTETESHDILSWSFTPGPLALEITDAQGNPVTGLANNSEGWPVFNTVRGAVANPLTISMTLLCSNSEPACPNEFQLEVSSSNGKPRFYPSHDSLGTICPEQIPSANATSYQNYFASCWVGSIGELYVPSGTIQTRRWSIWAQPSEQGELIFTATWDLLSGTRMATRAVAVPSASIHPVVFLHGILGSMPPKNSVIAQWPQGAAPSNGAWLDPFLGTYDPLIENLLKIGYEIDKSLFPVTYDWRQSNTFSACYLRSVLATTVQTKANPLPYVTHDSEGGIDADVVVHSMGGIVLRTYLENLGRETVNADFTCNYNHDINKAVFIATPHRGFPVTYNTWEGLTWADYLTTEVPWQSNGVFDGFFGLSLLNLMDNTLWPFFVVKQYNPNSLEPCWGLGVLDYFTRACPKEVILAYSHNRTSQHGRARGIRSLVEMLPDQAASTQYPYLRDQSQNPYPFGRQSNTLLDGGSGLNAASRLALLTSHIPPGNLYVIYNDQRDTTQSYTVAEPPPLTELPQYCSPSMIPGCVVIPDVQWWPDGAYPTASTTTGGDDLIPQYSTNLQSFVPSIPTGNVLRIDDGGHKLIVSSHKTQSAVAAILTGYDKPLDAIQPNNLFPVYTNYSGPSFLSGNASAVLSFLAYSPVDMLIIDPLGRRVGHDPASGQFVNEIPGALYSGNDTDMEFVLLPGNLDGDYTITTVGTGSGPYTIVAQRSTATGVELIGGSSGTATPGQTSTATVTYRPVADGILFEDLSAAGAWASEGGWGASGDNGDATPPAWTSDATAAATPGQPATLTMLAPLDLTVARQARLTFNTRATLASDAQALVEISSDDGATWLPLAQQPAGDMGWEHRTIDLTRFTLPSSTPILLRFHLLPAAASDRWLVDDIRVESIQAPDRFSIPFDDNLEGWRRWEAIGGWSWSEASAHSATHAWSSTTPGGSLTLAGTLVMTNVTCPQLTFWQTTANNTTGAVEVSSDAGHTWAPVYTTTSGASQWTQVTVDLSAYGGNNLSLRFRHSGGGAWAIDDVGLQNSPPPVIHTLPFNDTMESPADRWLGINSWAKTSDRSHSSQASWRSKTPESALKLVDQVDLSGAILPNLAFWHMFDLPAGSLGTLEASIDGGFTWTPLYTQTTSLTNWTATTVDLSAYAGQKVALAFHLQQVGAGATAQAGWYVDDVTVSNKLLPSGQIAYRTASGIQIMDPDGAQRQLTNNSTDNYPIWSPDHTRIAFVSSRDGNEEIYAINADGTGLRRLTNSATYDLAPAWSPDGTKILFFSKRAGNAEIYTMSAADGSGLQRLTTNAADDTYPTWSPNGLRITFDSTRPGNEEIYVMNANGSNVRRMSVMAGYDHFPYWAPNSQTVLFTGYHTGNDVFTVNADTAVVKKITTVTADDYYASWSPDGARILFMSVRDGNAEIYVMNADGSAQTRLTNTSVNESYANWSPDGTMIAFVRGGDIYVMNATGGGERRLPNVGKATDLNWWRPVQIR
jgi:Tol biopolymer transport system component